MKIFRKIKTGFDKFSNLNSLTKAIVRFPIAYLIIISILVLEGKAIANINGLAEYSETFPNSILINALFIAFLCFVAARLLTERFGKTTLRKILFPYAALLVSVGYYLLTRNNNIYLVNQFYTNAAVAALVLLIVCIPSIKGGADFNSVFSSFFKAFFISAIFTAVIYTVILAIDNPTYQYFSENGSELSLDYFNFILPILSMLMLPFIPIFSNTGDDESLKEASGYNKLFSTLLSYILIPLSAVYTLILIAYIGITAVNGSWIDNELEIMILIYSITILILYILVSNLENRFAYLYRKIMPKLLVPIALFQIVLSVISVISSGIVVSNYYAIMFLLFSAVSGILFWFLPVRKNGFLAVCALVLLVISFLPGVNPISVSGASQSALLERVLEKNGILDEDHNIIKKLNIPDEDKWTIVESVDYLMYIRMLDGVDFIPAEFKHNFNYEQTFGFDVSCDYYYNVQYQLRDQAVKTDGYDYVVNFNYNNYLEFQPQEVSGCSLDIDVHSDELYITRKGKKIISESFDDMFTDIFKNYQSTEVNYTTYVTEDRMTFEYDNDFVNMKVVFTDANYGFSISGESIENRGSGYIFVTIK